MSLIVEDGSMVTGAESYCSVAEATAYHAARGNAAWAAIATTELKEQALRKATDYMEQFYRQRWKGWRVSSTQVLSWPRANVEVFDTPYWSLVAQTEVPTPVKNACCELALRAAAADLAADLTRGKSSVTVGPIAVTYDAADPQYKRFRAVDAVLAPYLSGGSANARVVAR